MGIYQKSLFSDYQIISEHIASAFLIFFTVAGFSCERLGWRSCWLYDEIVRIGDDSQRFFTVCEFVFNDVCVFVHSWEENFQLLARLGCNQRVALVNRNIFHCTGWQVDSRHTNSSDSEMERKFDGMLNVYNVSAKFTFFLSFRRKTQRRSKSRRLQLLAEFTIKKITKIGRIEHTKKFDIK